MPLLMLGLLFCMCLHVFVVSFLRIQGFGQNGGAALDALNPKFELFRKNVNEIFNVNFSLPQNVEVCGHKLQSPLPFA